MKIRPKTFACALELVKQGYDLYVDDGVWTEEAEVGRADGGLCFIWWPYVDMEWHDTQASSLSWQKSSDWYFKKDKNNENQTQCMRRIIGTCPTMA